MRIKTTVRVQVEVLLGQPWLFAFRATAGLVRIDLGELGQRIRAESAGRYRVGLDSGQHLHQFAHGSRLGKLPGTSIHGRPGLAAMLEQLPCYSPKPMTLYGRMPSCKYIGRHSGRRRGAFVTPSRWPIRRQSRSARSSMCGGSHGPLPSSKKHPSRSPARHTRLIAISSDLLRLPSGGGKEAGNHHLQAHEKRCFLLPLLPNSTTSPVHPLLVTYLVDQHP